MKPTHVCRQCRVTFAAYNQTGGAAPRFCSRRCYGIDKRGSRRPRGGELPCACEWCGGRFVAYRRNAGQIARFCSRTCYAAHQRGKVPAQLAAQMGRVAENAAHWKGGRVSDGRGYIIVRIGRRYRLEHRVIMERMLGRPLTREEIVHHRNGVKDDNRPENLQLTDRSEHRRLHKKSA